MSEPEGDALGPAETRAVALLGLLRAEEPPVGDALTDSVMRTARWQYALRGTLSTLNDLSGALVDGALMVFGGRSSKERS